MLSNSSSNLLRFPVKLKTVGEIVKEFEDFYFSCKQRTPTTDRTWKNEYWLVFNGLPQHCVLTTELILDLVKSTTPDTRNRKRYCHSLSTLANFAGLQIDLQPYMGNYSYLKPAPRDLPSDELIESTYHRIKSSSWWWVFGMLAAYGLRPHELWYLDYDNLRSGDKCLRVLDGKTGERIVFPFKPDWFEEFSLTDINLPNTKAKYQGNVTGRICHAFKRLKIPFVAYSLRHSWAVRTITYGLDISLAAQQMGHSMAIHSQVYHRWISEQVHRAAYEALTKGKEG